MFYEMYSEVLNQKCILKTKNNICEMDCTDGTHYTQKEMFLIWMHAKISKMENKTSTFPKSVHDIKKVFDGEIVEIVEVNETIETKKRRQNANT